MKVLKIKYLLFFAGLIFAAKPFMGFHAFHQLDKRHFSSIFVKSFTKRKQEFIEDSEYDISTAAKRLADPITPFTALFSLLLSALFPLVFAPAKLITNSGLATIRLDSPHPLNRYLLSGKLLI